MVPGHQTRPPHPDLALGPVRDVLAAAGVDEAYVHAGDGRPAGTVDSGPVGAIHRDHAAGLGTAVRVEQRRAEGLLHGLAQSRTARRTGHDAHPQRLRELARRVDQSVICRRHTGQHGEGPAEPLVRREQFLPQTARREQLTGDPGARAHSGHAQDRQRMAEAVEQRKRPEQPVVGREAEDRGVAGGHGPQRGPLRGQHALGPVRGPRRVEHPGRIVEPEQVDLRGSAALDRAQEQRGAVRDRAAPCDQDAQAVVRRSQAAQLCEMRGVGDDELGTAVLEEVRQLGVGGPRIQGDADHPRAQHGEATLHRLHAVAEADRDAVAAAQRCPGFQVRGQRACAALQLGVGDAARGVGVGDPLRGHLGVLPQQLRHGPDQLVTPHVFTFQVPRGTTMLTLRDPVAVPRPAPRISRGASCRR